MSDLDDPDRAMVEMRVAARHSGIPGTVPDFVSHDTCHLRRVTAAVLKLKKPSCVWQDEQKTLRLRDCVSIKSFLLDEPFSKSKQEYWSNGQRSFLK